MRTTIRPITGTLLEIPLSALIPSPFNVRKTAPDPAGIAELAALIASQGLINPLSVIEQVRASKKGSAPVPTGFYEVIAGGRRLASLALLAAQKVISTDEPITCTLRSQSEALEVSTGENSGRERMNTADEFEAFRRLVDSGKTVEEVAARFGVDSIVVKQRLKLANVATEFVELFRSGKIKLDVLCALAITNDHELQRRVWSSLGSNNRYAIYVRRALTEGEVEASEPMARFVGSKAYEKAGGQIRRDLFQQDHGGYFMDRALLERLAQEKLDKAAIAAKADGAAWVDVVARCDYATRQEYREPQQVRREPTAKQQAALDALRAEADALEKEMNVDPNLSDDRYQELDGKLDAVYRKQRVIEDKLMVDDPNQLEAAGAVVSISGSGKLEIMTGVLRKADALRLQAKKGSSSNPGDAVDGSEPAPTHSDTMVRRLSAHRTLALQAELMQRPDVALAALVAQLAGAVFGPHGLYGMGHDFNNRVDVQRGGVMIRCESMSGDLRTTDATESPAAVAMKAKGAEWMEVLRTEVTEGDVLGWLLTQPQERTLSLLAFCTAASTDATQMSGRSPRPDADRIARAVSLDVRKWWKPTAAAYFSAMPKARIIEAAEEITGTADDGALAKLKKGPLADKAEQLASDAGWTWLPEPLREPTAA